MFKHKGKSRTFSHNLKIASLLSFVAGIVNVAGFLSVQRLTTNVTGHFAFFMDEVYKLHFRMAFFFLLFTFFFFLGSFISNLIVESITRKNDKYIYRVPVLIEIIILSAMAFSGKRFIEHFPNLITCFLLFAMGLQNSLVTSISNSVVRTTHLTGLFTDLGIELSQLFFYRQPEQKKKLFSSIKLRFFIIGFFFIGGIIGGIVYSKIKLLVLLLASFVLLLGLIYDSVKYRVLILKRNLLKKQAS